MSIGRLEPVDPREIWPNEARDFTPWLQENPQHLAEVLGIEIEFEAAERAVGGFALDLLGRDLTNDAVLIVENQLGITDHPHLGQLLTYAAGTDAATVVWIAVGFRDEHRQALDWLNEQTGEETRFFGVDLGVRRIGESLPAPLLEVVAQPNNWQKQIRAAARAARASGRGQLYLDFWAKFLDRLQQVHPEWTRSKPVVHNYLVMRSPISGAYLNPVFGDRSRIRHELWVDSGDAEKNREIFLHLEAQKVALESAYGRELDWDYREDRKACRIAEHADGQVSDEERHDEFIDWFIEAGERMRHALSVIELPLTGNEQR